MSKESAVPCEPDDAGSNAPAPEASPTRLVSRSPRGLIVALRARPRRTTLFVALSALAAVGLVAGGLVYRPNAGGVVIAGPSSVVFGSDGIPTQVDGQRVYRVGDKATWQNLSGGFLLGGYELASTRACAMGSGTPPPAEADLLDTCQGPGMASKPSVAGLTATDVWLAPMGSDVVEGWIGGPPIVVRVHSHDPEAAGCAPHFQAVCRAAIVVQAVLWPVLPTEIGGQSVYRQTAAVFPTLGSFLLGGPFVKPDVLPPCPMQPGLSTVQQQLIPYCYILSIDGLDLAPKSSIDEPNDELIVARVHVNDPEAAKCPSDYRAQCKAAIVVESVVWRAPAG